MYRFIAKYSKLLYSTENIKIEKKTTNDIITHSIYETRITIVIGIKLLCNNISKPLIPNELRLPTNLSLRQYTLIITTSLQEAYYIESRRLYCILFTTTEYLVHTVIKIINIINARRAIHLVQHIYFQSRSRSTNPPRQLAYVCLSSLRRLTLNLDSVSVSLLLSSEYRSFRRSAKADNLSLQRYGHTHIYYATREFSLPSLTL